MLSTRNDYGLILLRAPHELLLATLTETLYQDVELPTLIGFIAFGRYFGLQGDEFV